MCRTALLHTHFATHVLHPTCPLHLALPSVNRILQEVDGSIKSHLREGISGGFDEERFGQRIGFGNLRRCGLED